MVSKYNKKTKKTEWIPDDGDFVLDGFDDHSEDIYNDSSARGSLMTQMIMNTNRRMQMAYNPRTYNLFQQIDISNALEKARVYLDETEDEAPSISIKTDKPLLWL